MDRKFKIIGLIIFAALTLVMFSGGVEEVWSADRPITPYGDYCPMVSVYGRYSGKAISIADAERALREYYLPRGFTIAILKAKGRFLIVNVLKDRIVVDTIVFDRHTGRIRSIY